MLPDTRLEYCAVQTLLPKLFRDTVINSLIDLLLKCKVLLAQTYEGPISVAAPFTFCSRSLAKSEGKRPLGRPRRRWVDNIRTDLQEVGCGYMDWIGLAQDRDRWRTLVSAVMDLRVP